MKNLYYSVALILFFCLTFNAKANTLKDPYQLIHISGSNMPTTSSSEYNTNNTIRHVSYTDHDLNFIQTTSQISLSSDTPYVSSTSSSNTNNFTSLGRTRLTYEFMIQGYDSVDIPINLTSLLSTTVSINNIDLNYFSGESQSIFNLYQNSQLINTHHTYLSLSQNSLKYTIDNFSVTDRSKVYNSYGIYKEYTDLITIETNKIYTIQLFTTTYEHNASVAAFADPFIEIDKSFDDADKYKLVFSDGINNIKSISNPIPEPSTVFLTFLGILGIIVTNRKK